MTTLKVVHYSSKGLSWEMWIVCHAAPLWDLALPPGYQNILERIETIAEKCKEKLDSNHFLTCLRNWAEEMPTPCNSDPVYPLEHLSHRNPGTVLMHRTPGKHGLNSHYKHTNHNTTQKNLSRFPFHNTMPASEWLVLEMIFSHGERLPQSLINISVISKLFHSKQWLSEWEANKVMIKCYYTGFYWSICLSY